MKVVAYTPLHYGKEYLEYAVASTADLVDRHIILYSPVPSYGFQTDLPCPDTEEELRDCLSEFNHIEWHEGRWSNWQHHWAETNRHLHEDDDILIAADADEIWDLPSMEKAIKEVYDADKCRNWKCTGFLHFWRSFRWICTDEMAPDRILDLRHSGGYDFTSQRIYHFGYAESIETVRYKWTIHLHQMELRSPDWFEETFVGWKPGDEDLHPTVEGIWNPRGFRKESLPLFMRFHPYYDLEVIE